MNLLATEDRGNDPAARKAAGSSPKVRPSRIRNRAIIDEAKARPCADCGQSFPAAAMDLHHRDHTIKSFTVGRNLDPTEQALRAEIQKCDVLCAVCHRLRHIEIKDFQP